MVNIFSQSLLQGWNRSYKQTFTFKHVFLSSQDSSSDSGAVFSSTKVNSVKYLLTAEKKPTIIIVNKDLCEEMLLLSEH